MNLREYRKNTHQTHAEDLVLLGKEGLSELNDKIDKFLRRFNNEEKELNLTQKIDGAPALFCWSKYPGYPDNSIALKGFTSGPQNALSSNEQIDAKYGDRPDMAAKLKLGLQLAKYIPAGECWQGDCLFSKGDLKEEEINGTDYLTFMPNKIVYAFSEDNADYNKVRNADFGIAFHTIYKDNDGEMRQGFNVDPTRLNAPDNFYIMSPAINASKEKVDYDLGALEQEYNNLKQLEQKLVNDPAYEELINNSTFMNYWNTFENANLADKKQVNLNVNTFIGDLKEYVNDKLGKEYNKKLNTVKTDKGRQSATDKYNKDTQELANLIDTHKDTLTNLVNCLNSAANIKMLMWAGLKKAKNDYSTFYKSRTKGYIPSEGEGIAMSTNDGNIVKIVDRSTFSSYNRDPDIMSGFEHESLQETLKRIDKGTQWDFNNNWSIKATYNVNDVINLLKDKNYKIVWDEDEGIFIIGDPYYVTHNDIRKCAYQKGLIDHDHRLVDLYHKIPGGGDPDEYDYSNEFEGDVFKTKLPGTSIEGTLYVYPGYPVNTSNPLESIVINNEHENFGVATQMADMGTFNKFSSKKKLKLKEDNSRRLAVVGAGRFNPPTIGHQKLIGAMASYAKGDKPKLFITHSMDTKKNPLSYDSKVRWCQKAFGDKVDVVNTDAKTILQFLQELYNDGYTDIIYVGGGDRIGGDEDVTQTILKYNGQPDKKGNIIYDFNSIDFKNAGSRSGEDLASNASASLARRYVLENDLGHFKEIVPFNDKDATALFKELKYAMKGKEESFLESCLNEAASEKINTPLGNLLKNIINKKFLDIDFAKPNPGRDPKDALRVVGNSSEDELVSKLKKALKPLPKDTIQTKSNQYHIVNIDFNDISKHQGASGSYNSIPIEIESLDGSEKDTLYITLKTSENKKFYDKQFTPNKVLANGIGEFEKYNKLIFNEGYEFLKNIYDQATENVEGDLNRFESTVTDMAGVNDMNINAIMKDFGEVLSAGCLANLLGKPNNVFFPAGSNEPLIDFIVNGNIKVSQKAESGATPSGDAIFEIIASSLAKGEIDINQVLNGYSKKDINRIKLMIEFFRNEVYSRSVDIHSGFVNLANMAASGSKFVNIPDVSNLRGYFKGGSVTSKNINKFINSIKNYIGSSIKYDESRISSKEYCDTLRIRYIARIAIKAINEDRVLIDGLNDLLSACLGQFIQVYLVKPNEFIKGHLIFNVKKIDNDNKYEFVDNSGISKTNDKLSTSKLGTKLKH